MKTVFCTLAFFALFPVTAQTLEPRSRCDYEKQTNRIDNTVVSTVERETCVEEPGASVSPVKIGDLIRPDYVQPHPVIKDTFRYQNARCRWFVQTNTSNRNLIQYQGIACEIQTNVWRVIDKF